MLFLWNKVVSLRSSNAHRARSSFGDANDVTACCWHGNSHLRGTTQQLSWQCRGNVLPVVALAVRFEARTVGTTMLFLYLNHTRQDTVDLLGCWPRCCTWSQYQSDIHPRTVEPTVLCRHRFTHAFRSWALLTTYAPETVVAQTTNGQERRLPQIFYLMQQLVDNFWVLASEVDSLRRVRTQFKQAA